MFASLACILLVETLERSINMFLHHGLGRIANLFVSADHERPKLPSIAEPSIPTLMALEVPRSFGIGFRK
jgi:hypothetical protein